jgi:DNA-binding beta-propeller fold protein YncE
MRPCYSDVLAAVRRHRVQVSSSERASALYSPRIHHPRLGPARLRVHRTTLGASVLAALLTLGSATATQHVRTQASSKSDTNNANNSAPYRETRRIILPDEELSGGITVDSTTQTLYVARRTHISVLKDSGQVVASVADTKDVVAVALVPDIDRGFAAAANKNSITVFDSNSFAKITSLAVPGRDGKNLAYDAASRRLFVMNNRSQSVVAVSVDDPKVLATIPLVDDPESAVSDGKGRLYVVLADPAEIAVIDTAKLSLLERLQLSPCNEPRGVALDSKARRLFVGCSNGMLVVLDPESPKLVAHLTVEEGTGDVVLDAAAHVVFTANSAGTVTVISEEFPDKYRILATIPTARGASHLAIDQRTHEVFVPLPKSASDRRRDEKSKAAGAVIVVIGRS